MEITDHAEGPLEIIEMDAAPFLELLDEPGALLPGSEGPVLLPHDEEEGAEEERPTDWTNDGDHRHFIVYLKNRLDNIPRHSGSTTVGCEKAIAFLKRLDREISKAVQSDEDDVIDESEAESIRDQIMEFVSQLEDAHDSLRSSKRSTKKSTVMVGKQIIARLGDGHDFKYYVPIVRDGDEEFFEVSIAEPDDDTVQKFVKGEEQLNESLKKEGSTAKIVLYVDPFMQCLTRLLIDGHVSAGHNMEKMFQHMNKKYKLTDREKLGIQEVLLQKGFPIFKDFGLDGEVADPTLNTGLEFSTVYPA